VLSVLTVGVTTRFVGDSTGITTLLLFVLLLLHPANASIENNNIIREYFIKYVSIESSKNRWNSKLANPIDPCAMLFGPLNLLTA
jgi:hypothetical protein